MLVTENGIATADDERRIAYTTGALQGLLEAIADGIDVRGYLHWSALDNFEWGHWEPTFGLIAVDRETSPGTRSRVSRGSARSRARTALHWEAPDDHRTLHGRLDLPPRRRDRTRPRCACRTTR